MLGRVKPERHAERCLDLHRQAERPDEPDRKETDGKDLHPCPAPQQVFPALDRVGEDGHDGLGAPLRGDGAGPKEYRQQLRGRRPRAENRCRQGDADLGGDLRLARGARNLRKTPA